MDKRAFPQILSWGWVDPDHPTCDVNVLIWHPVFGVQIAYCKSDRSFWDEHGNELTAEAEIRWWMPLPEAPPLEEDPGYEK